MVAHFPNLRELYISGSTLHIANTPPSLFQKTEILDLQFSNITSWTDLADLSTLPRLHTLILSNNQIPQVAITQGQFPTLSCLSLDNNAIRTWESVAQIATLPALTTLRIRKNPLTEGPGLDMRLLVVAMVTRVTKLNGSPITDTERLQADLFYLKYFAKDYREGGEGFHALHPRYAALVREHGEPGRSEPTITSIKEQAIVVTFQHADKTFTKKVLRTTLVKNIQVMVQRQFRIPPKEQEISWVDPANQRVVLTEDPTRDLAYYYISTDCTLHVERQ